MGFSQSAFKMVMVLRRRAENIQLVNSNHCTFFQRFEGCITEAPGDELRRLLYPHPAF